LPIEINSKASFATKYNGHLITSKSKPESETRFYFIIMEPGMKDEDQRR
jgi:hypothetical protein